ncbi:MAG: hypothetical protein AAFR17_15770 [Pseudomonadota bacterium]
MTQAIVRRAERMAMRLAALLALLALVLHLGAAWHAHGAEAPCGPVPVLLPFDADPLDAHGGACLCPCLSTAIDLPGAAYAIRQTLLSVAWSARKPLAENANQVQPARARGPPPRA